MAEIPSAFSIATPAPRPTLDVPEQNANAGAPGRALADFGAGVSAESGRILDEQDELQFATARSAFLQKKATFENSLVDDKDWATIPDRYKEAIGQFQSETASSIQNPKFRERFALQSGLETTQGLIQMQRLAHTKQVDAAVGSLTNTLESSRAAALASPTNAPALIDSALGAIKGANASGFIDDQAAVNIRQKWTQDYGKGWLTIQPDAVQSKLLTDPTAKTGTPADFVDPAERVILKREADQRLRSDNAVRGQVFAQSVADQVAFLRNGGDPAHATITNDQISAVYGDTPEGKEIASENDRALKYNTTVRKMALAPQSEVNAILQRDQPGAHVGGSVNDAIHGQESGNNPNAPTSVDGAVGIGQMKQGTFDEFAQAGEDINKPEDNLAVSNRAIEAYKTKYTNADGTPDASRVAVAYFSGPGNVAPAGSALPYKNDAKDGNGKTTSSYVNDVLGRMNGTEGYRADLQDYNAERDVAAHRTQALATDPAAYAVAADPATGAAYLEAQKGPQQFDHFVQRLNGTYAALELPPEQRWILPVEDARATIKNLNTMPPKDAVAQIDTLKQVSGRWWPQVYSELASRGLPPAFQAVTIADPQDAQVMVAAMQTGKGHASVGATISEDDKKAGGTLDESLGNNEALRNLRGSLTAYGRSGIDLYNGTLQAVKQTAMYLMDQNPSLGANDAATKAAGMVTEPFDFMEQGDHPPARLPKGTLDRVQPQTQAVLAALGPGDVQPYPAPHGLATSAAAGDATDAERHDAALAGAKSAWWLTVPASDGGTVLRAIDPHTNLPVIRSNGQKIDIKANSANLGTVGPAAPVSGAPPAKPSAPAGKAALGAAGGVQLPAAPPFKTGRRGR